MTEERSAQIIAALEWATGNRERTAKVESNHAGSETMKLMIFEYSAGGCYCVVVKEDSGTDFTAMIAEEERKKDEAELLRLEKKLGKI